jgi:monoamine oxidase
MTFDVAVIGAGAAGIAAARRLTELGRTVTIVEAAGSVGGRASTDNRTFGFPFDRGCYWLHSSAQNPLKLHAEQLNIRYIAGAPAPRFVCAGNWLDADESKACAAAIDAAFVRIAAAGHAGEDRAAAELLNPADPFHPAFVSEFVVKQGVVPEQGSTLDFARYVWTGEDLPVVGGLGNLIGRLGQGFAVSLANPASLIDRRATDRIRIETELGTVEARTVIVTVSTGVLRSDAIRFLPALPDRHLAAIEALPMGHCNKIALAFTSSVLGDVANGIVVPLGNPGDATELVLRPDGNEMAIALVSGPFGRALAEAGSPAMIDYLVERLAELFGSRIRTALAPARATVDWDRDPFVRGYVSAALPGRADARIDLAQPVDGRLFFAGEATSISFMGDVHGAWLSGIDAADEAARQLAHRARRDT